MTQQSLSKLELNELEIKKLFIRNNMTIEIGEGPFWYALERLSIWDLSDFASMRELIRERDLLINGQLHSD